MAITHDSAAIDWGRARCTGAFWIDAVVEGTRWPIAGVCMPGTEIVPQFVCHYFYRPGVGRHILVSGSNCANAISVLFDANHVHIRDAASKISGAEQVGKITVEGGAACLAKSV